ncbi:hypothetical protein [Pedobacter sp. UYP30]|uniref:hypothetical protein n=1 Tax=Pedobacter sp. UYP30 TaxID=1756400 RepID=UPI00339B911F
MTNKGYRIFGLSFILAFSFFLIYSTYTAIYPTSSFYLSEFKEVTLREAPKSTTIIRKETSYPDFHGDYCSASLIELSKGDYLKLLNELSKDTRISKITQDDITMSEELIKVMGTIKTEQIIDGFTRHIVNQEDQYLFIGFLADKKTIILNICAT